MPGLDEKRGTQRQPILKAGTISFDGPAAGRTPRPSKDQRGCARWSQTWPAASGRQRGSIRRAEGDGVVYRSPLNENACCDGSQQAL